MQAALTLTALGTLYGSTLALSLGRRSRHEGSASEGWLAAVLLCGLLAADAIALQQVLTSPAAARVAALLEAVTALALGPLVLGYTRAALGRQPLPMPVQLLPAAVAGLIASFGVPVAAELFVGHQVAYTLLGLLHRPFAKNVTPRVALRLLYATLLAVHLAQGVRMTTGSLPFLLPLLLALAVLALTLYVPLRAPQLLPFAARGVERAPVVSPTAKAVAKRLRETVQRERLHLQPDLGLAELAAAIGTTPHEVSAALNGVLGAGFHELLARLRTEEAKQNLLDPRLRHLTIDGIARASGFGSRSAFYQTFRRLTGSTPTAYRRQAKGPSPTLSSAG